MMKPIYEGLLFIAVLCIVCWVVFETGKAVGQQQCQASQAKSNEKAQATANTQTKTAIKRATTAGQAQEKSRAALDQFFDQLQKDASHEQATSTADTCSLSAARLRLWNYANTGRADPADSGTAAIQPDPSTPATTPSSLGQAGRPGSQPPAGDTGISPAGGAHVQPAGLSGDQP